MKLSFRFKAIFAFLTVGFILAGIGGFSVWSLRNLESTFLPIVASNLPKLKVIIQMQGYVKESAIPIMEVPSFIENADKLAELNSDFKSWAGKFLEIQSQFNKFSMNEDEATTNTQLAEKWKQYLEVSTRAFAEAIAAKNATERAKVVSLVNDDVDTIRIELNDSLARVANYQTESAEQLAANAKTKSLLLERISLGAVTLGFFLSVLMGVLFSNWISRTLTQISSSLKDGAGQLLLHAQALQKSSSDLKVQIGKQAASVQETASACEEISNTVKTARDGTEVSMQKTEDSSVLVDHAHDAMTEMRTSIVRISESFKKITDEVSQSQRGAKEVSTLMNEIRAKTQLVNDIVFQTKLLSFNASVEAARAGEAGKGFSVVAEEVGKLAQMSGKAAAEINEIIDKSIQRVVEVFSQIQTGIGNELQDGNQRVGAGEVNVNSCTESLEKIKHAISELKTVANEIAIGSAEQEKGIEEINKSISFIDRGLQSNSKSADGVQEQSLEFGQLAGNLSSIVEQLDETLTGAKKSLSPHVAAEDLSINGHSGISETTSRFNLHGNDEHAEADSQKKSA